MSMDEENVLIGTAMQIILFAGDARNDVENALKEARQFHFAEAEEYFRKAEENIRKAHNAQTEIIQNEASGKSYEQCLLFTHAQDTLMTIMSELRLAKEMREILLVINKTCKEEKNE